MAPIRLEQLFDVARGDSASGESPLASKFQSCRAIAAGEAQYAETRADPLLGVFTSAEQSLNVGTDGNPECGGILKPDVVFFGVLIFMAAGLIVVALLDACERRFERWRPAVR